MCVCVCMIEFTVFLFLYYFELSLFEEMNGRILFFLYNSSSVCSDFRYLGILNGREAHVMFKYGNISCISLLNHKALKLGI